MKRLLLSASVMLVAMSAATSAMAAGVNLAWTDCRGDGGVSNRTFACAANTGSNTMVASFVAPAGVTNLSGNELVIDLISTTAPLPAWWAMKNVGSCRATSLSANAVISGAAVNCVDAFAGQGAGGIGAYTQVAPGGGWSISPIVESQHVRITIAMATPAPGPIDLDVEYFSANIIFNNAKTVGTGACAGCADPVCIVLNSIKLTQPVGLGDTVLGFPASPGSNQITWQGAGADCNAVPVRNTTWGSVKSLYR
jgi:hypothetical protein